MKKPSEKEADLLVNVKKILDLFKLQGLLSYRRMHVMPVMRGAGRFSVNKDMAGIEDLQIYLYGGKTIYMELKTKKGKQSDAQLQREEELLTLLHDYVVIRSVDELIKCLNERGLSIWAYQG
jgi:hypothetical protein